MAFILLNLMEASLRLFPSCRITQLMAEDGNTLGVPWAGQSNRRLFAVIELDSQLATPYMSLQLA
jgi:hypothetical protein